MVRNHYLLLGIPPDASQKQIKAVYRSLAKRFHPDRNKGSETAAELFRQVNHAYMVLSNPALRALYDKKLAARNPQGQTGRSTLDPLREDNPQKFKKFINSLLDALFGPLDEPNQEACQPQRATVETRQQGSRKPDFNFYYHLAVEKQSAPYSRGNDGIYRRATGRKRPGK